MANSIELAAEFQSYITNYLETRDILNNAKKKGYVIEISPDHWVLTEKGDKEWGKELGIE